MTRKDKIQNARIAVEWDHNVEHRARELQNGSDLTFRDVTAPLICEAVQKYSKGQEVLEVGSGLGFLSNLIAERGFSVTGVDVSSASIRYAAEHFPIPHFLNQSIQSFCAINSQRFDTCVASLVLHNLIDFENDLTAIAKALKPKGVLLGIMLNPEVWFAKRRSIAKPVTDLGYIGRSFHVPFRLNGNRPHPQWITYVDRTLDEYTQGFRAAGFQQIQFRHYDNIDRLPPDLMLFICHKIQEISGDVCPQSDISSEAKF